MSFPHQSQATICHVLHGLEVGGAEVLAARMARQLADRFDFVFACLDDLGPLGAQLRADGFRVELLERRPGVDFRCARRLRRLCRELRVDLLHAHQYAPFAYALLSGAARRRPPILFTEHGRSFPDFPRRKRIAFNRLLLRPRDRIAAVGESVRQALIDNEGLAARRVRVIYNGVDPAPLADPSAARTEARRELGLRPDDFVLIQVARLDGVKDHSTALRMLARLTATRPEVRLLFVGEGPRRAALEKEIEQRQLAAFVKLLGLRNDVPRLLAAADACVLTSASEGVPLALLEAMALRLPIVATDVGGVGEVAPRDAAGLLAPAGDDAALAAAVSRLADDAALRERLGAAGRRRVEQQFGEADMLAAYVGLYEEMPGASAR
jgi:glycosyltransferase involved in cell wall biosynthesis